MNLLDSIRYVKGVGPAKEKLFNKLNIYSIKDLIYYFPRDYEDRTKLKKIMEIYDGEKSAFEAEVLSKAKQIPNRSRLKIYTITVGDSTGKVTLFWFNTDYIRNILKPGQKYVFFGEMTRNIKGNEMKNPVFEQIGANKKTGKILSIYPSTADLSQTSIRDAEKYIFDNMSVELSDIIPKSIRERENLVDINNALRSIHFPTDEESYKSARRRLAFEELLVFQLGMMKLKKLTEDDNAGISFKKNENIETFLKSLPFKLTNAQERVTNDILEDMQRTKSMKRLLQGDVGSGKTVVAMTSILNAVKNGYQAVLMAPTSILAEQHLETFNLLLKKENVKIELLSGRLTIKEKQVIKKKIYAGEADIVIGTHAILEDDVVFNNLGLIITDEQHRFGVNQRNKLTQKGKNPDTLVMTATPIPRTLAFILYGDLDISIIDELPPNRKKIETYLVDESMEERINNFILKEIKSGRQVYIVCPAIEENEEEEESTKIKNVNEVAQSYKKIFPDISIEILHGKMKPSEKDEIMRRFKENKTNILISTTVIEVGVNVPNATIMIVENAERFGLAELHQLRGRVGRGSEKSYCILSCHNLSKISKERMEIMIKTDDGFKIAEKDLELRGPGEFLGIRQHGIPEFKIANIFADADIIGTSSRIAKEIIYENRDEYKELFLQVEEKFKEVVL